MNACDSYRGMIGDDLMKGCIAVGSDETRAVFRDRMYCIHALRQTGGKSVLLSVLHSQIQLDMHIKVALVAIRSQEMCIGNLLQCVEIQSDSIPRDVHWKLVTVCGNTI
jgi:hypothetical protein